MNQTLYVRDEDEKVWQEAKEAAKRRRMSLSAYVTTAVEAYNAAAPETPPGQIPVARADRRALAVPRSSSGGDL